MHLKVIIIGLLILVFSCSKTGNTTKQTTNLSDTVAIADSRSVSSSTPDSASDTSKPDSADTSFSYGTELVEQKKACYAAFKSIKTSSDFLKAYYLLSQLEADMNTIYDSMNSLPEYGELLALTNRMMGNALPWILADLIAEGTVPISAINNKELEKSALLSPQKDDDAFADLLLATYGESGSRKNGIPVWTVMNCDVCYACVLGNGATFKAFQKADSIKATSSQFASVADSVIGEFFIGKNTIFEYPKDEIIAEIDTILAKNHLTDAQKAFLTDCRESVSDTSKSHVQINCSNGDCTY